MTIKIGSKSKGNQSPLLSNAGNLFAPSIPMVTAISAYVVYRHMILVIHLTPRRGLSEVMQRDSDEVKRICSTLNERSKMARKRNTRDGRIGIIHPNREEDTWR